MLVYIQSSSALNLSDCLVGTFHRLANVYIVGVCARKVCFQKQAALRSLPSRFLNAVCPATCPAGMSPVVFSHTHSEKLRVENLDWGEDPQNHFRSEAEALVKRVSDIFLSASFEFAIAILLVINLLVMAAQLQYHGIKMGYQMSFPRYGLSAEEAWPGAENFFVIADISFAIVFTLEMMVRVMNIGRSLGKQGV